MKVRFLITLLMATLLCITMVSSVNAAKAPSSEYWVIDQYPEDTVWEKDTVYLYTPDGANVSFGDGMQVLSTRTIPPNQIVSYLVADLGFTGDNFYYMEISADSPILVSLADAYSDQYNVRPPSSFSDEYYFALQQSSPGDDILAIYSPTETSISISGHQFTTPISTTITVSGLETFNVEALLGLGFHGYSLKLEADTPVAATITDNGLEWIDERFPFGLQGGELGQTSLADDYTRIVLWHTAAGMYSLEANVLGFFDEAGTQVGTKSTGGAESFFTRFADVGYSITPGVPTFVRVNSSAPLANSYLYPTAEETTAEAMYLGADSGNWPANTILGLHSSTATSVQVINGITGQSAPLSLAANEVVSVPLADLGIFAPGPFLAHVRADLPIYQEISIRASGTIAGHVRSRLQQYAPTNQPPSINTITVPIDPFPVNTEVEVSAGFTDPNPADTHTALWDWGDETTSAGTVNQADGEVTGSHTYETPGVYTVELTVTDNHDASDVATTEQYIVVYDPDGAFVTGGGWIDSPEGAYAEDLTLAGKANFGFVSKYKKGASVPTGETEFQFKVADLNFHSTSYDWLVIAGARAQYKGDGTINGEGDFGFMLTAIDGALPGGLGEDKFRIKIWDKPTDAVVYDNQMGEDDTAEPATTLGGGSIVIHKN